MVTFKEWPIHLYSKWRKWQGILKRSFVFYCSENSSVAHNLGTTGQIQVGFSAKCTSPNEHFIQIENWKCHIFELWLISLDRITYENLLVAQTICFQNCSILVMTCVCTCACLYASMCAAWLYGDRSINDKLVCDIYWNLTSVLSMR